MSVLGDIWEGLPKEVKIIMAIAIFLYAGTTILQGIVFVWNLVGVNGMNALNGCFTGNAAACVPQQNGIFIFGINFADYWTITVLIFLVPVAMFTIKWYGFLFGGINQRS